MEIIPWNEQRKQVFLDRYALRDRDGILLETELEQMWQRVASCIGGDAAERESFLEILRDFRFVPSGRILSGAGSAQKATYYNCFVIGVKAKDVKVGNDSRSGIMSTMSDVVEITSRGGGVGVNWSTLRPAGTFIRGVNGRSSGAETWMRGADALANAIRQGGSRTAALMFMLDDWHPDIMEFTRPGNKFSRANFSVNISNAFMEAVKNDREWLLQFPDISSPFYDKEWDGDLKAWIDKGLPVTAYKTIRAIDLWQQMIESAYMTGSPGVSFLDRCNETANTWYLDRAICMNPCGEQPLPANGSCNLGSINLVAFWDTERKDFRWPELDLVTRYSVMFLDRVIDVSEDINLEIGTHQRQVRRVGLGTMGLADVMILAKVRYGSSESVTFIKRLYSFIRESAYRASAELARSKGCAPGYEKSQYMEGKFIRTLSQHTQSLIKQCGIRNLSILTQAPTGTTSVLAGVSSGIEPIFSRDFVRKDATGSFRVTHPLFENAEGDHLVVAPEISVSDHIRVQAALQMFVDASISKTINMPNGSTTREISAAYQQAYDQGCKGITVYRNGSLDDVLKPYCESCSN